MTEHVQVTESPYDAMTVAELIHDFGYTRGDLSEQYARDFLVGILERRLADAWREGRESVAVGGAEVKNTRVKGHALRCEGSPYIGDGVCEVGGVLRRNPYDRLGVAVCQCGWRSEVLESNGARKEAHRAHKADVA